MKQGDEIEAFERLQARLADLYRRVFADPLHPRSVLVIPSLTLDQEVLARITGVHHYEERLLCLLLLLRLPRTRVVYVTSEPLSEAVIDYYLHLLPGIPHRHARQRLTLLSCDDASPIPLSRKILDRPRLVERIGEALGDRSLAHMVCFNVTTLERSLALELDVPIYGCNPELLHLGSKSGSRKLFRQAGIDMPDGCEDLADEHDIVEALAQLKRRQPQLRRAVVKLNEGFSGEGNAVFDFDGAPGDDGLVEWISARLPAMGFAASGMDWETYKAKVDEMGAIVEAFVEGERKRSPSAQFRIDPAGNIDIISTHDQILGGHADQVFLGSRFPADADYRLEIQEEGLKAARALLEFGVLGRFGIDFMSVHDGRRWQHKAIEINLRKGGTTYPYLMLQFLTGGSLDADTGLFRAADGQPRYYYTTDNLESERYRGLSPDDLIDIAVVNGIHFAADTQTGVVFHLIGALSEFGKLGVFCVGESPEQALALYRRTVEILDRECAG